MSTMKVMLACNAPADIPFPNGGQSKQLCWLASPKIDGIRAYVEGGRVWSRNNKLIPNIHVQQLFGKPYMNGCDGELTVGPPFASNVFRKTGSIVMSDAQTDDMIRFNVFDDCMRPGPYNERLRSARIMASRNTHAVMVPQAPVFNEKQLRQLEENWLEIGFEGLMIRNRYAPYKHGRSTVREQYLWKVKRWSSSEAVVIGVEEQMRNANDRDVYGKRSSHKAGMKGTGLMGALVVRDLKTGVEFNIGTGFTEEEREEEWLIGDFVRYKFFSSGSKDKPRFPVFEGRYVP